jgi:hypothetical protein
VRPLVRPVEHAPWSEAPATPWCRVQHTARQCTATRTKQPALRGQGAYYDQSQRITRCRAGRDKAAPIRITGVRKQMQGLMLPAECGCYARGRHPGIAAGSTRCMQAGGRALCANIKGDENNTGGSSGGCRQQAQPRYVLLQKAMPGAGHRWRNQTHGSAFVKDASMQRHDTRPLLLTIQQATLPVCRYSDPPSRGARPSSAHAPTSRWRYARPACCAALPGTPRACCGARIPSSNPRVTQAT